MSDCRIHRRTDLLCVHWLYNVPQLRKHYIDDIVEAAQCSRLKLEDFINYVSRTPVQIQQPVLDMKLKIKPKHTDISALQGDRYTQLPQSHITSS